MKYNTGFKHKKETGIKGMEGIKKRRKHCNRDKCKRTKLKYFLLSLYPLHPCQFLKWLLSFLFLLVLSDGVWVFAVRARQTRWSGSALKPRTSRRSKSKWRSRPARSSAYESQLKAYPGNG